MDVEDELETYQKIVEGYIECVSVGNNVVMVCNEEGMLHGLTPNIDAGCDIIYGTLFIVGTEGEEFRGLTSAEVAKYTSLLIKSAI